ncbi:MAG: molybdenum ABC transporter ATP-binding protein [Neomegalonema sp.]|nr:molybdenum ABC transporter ATP-binding protein [Neomegalonema sp.]
MSLQVDLHHRMGDFTLETRFEAPSGITVLFGHSGSGKTSVIQAVAGLLRPDEGRIAVAGQVLLDTQAGVFVPPHRRRTGYIFQEGRLFPHLSVRQNLLYGRWMQGRWRQDRPSQDRPANTALFDHVVEMLGIASLLGRRPSLLSGGEKQRVAIGRALLCEPQILLADEPLAALDEARKQEILPYFERLRSEAAIPILYVCHSAAEAARLANHVVALKQGRIIGQGAAGAFFSDAALAANLSPMEAGAIISGVVAQRHPDGLAEVASSAGRFLIPDNAIAPGSAIRLRIEAQDVMLALHRPEAISALNVLEAVVVSVQPGRGPGMLVTLRAGQEQILARITKRSGAALDLKAGDACYAVIKSVSVAPAAIGRSVLR